MQNIPYPPPRPLSVGEVLDLSFRIYRASVISCLLFAALGVIMNQLPKLYAVGGGATVMESVMRPTPGLAYSSLALAGALLGLLFNGAVILRQYHIVSGQPAGGELAASARRVPGMLLLLLLIILMVVVGVMIVAPAFLFGGTTRILAGVLLCLPLLYGLVAISCSFTAMLVAPMGAAGAFARSWRLTSGNFWRLVLIFSVGGVILLVLYLLTSGVAGVILGIFGRGDVAVITATLAVVIVAVGALAIPFYTALGLAVFGDLTARKEGTDLAQRIAAT